LFYHKVNYIPGRIYHFSLSNQGYILGLGAEIKERLKHLKYEKYDNYLEVIGMVDGDKLRIATFAHELFFKDKDLYFTLEMLTSRNDKFTKKANHFKKDLNLFSLYISFIKYLKGKSKGNQFCVHVYNELNQRSRKAIRTVENIKIESKKTVDKIIRKKGVVYRKQYSMTNFEVSPSNLVLGETVNHSLNLTDIEIANKNSTCNRRGNIGFLKKKINI